tara:strand:+ start:1820 stop:2845 length:1026 start_codon:yes stop_codon:yes gene_type:complete
MAKYIGEKNYQHGSKEKTGVLITNLGTPDAPTAKALRPYLKEFLSDTRVIEIPKFIWQIILRFVILQIRPQRSAKNYKKIWTDQGSPLLFISEKQVNLIEKKLKKDFPNTVFTLGMRYGNPSIKKALKLFQNKQVRRLLVFPLYPQYCAATTGSTFDEVTSIIQKWRWIPEIRFINQYFEEDTYIKAISDLIKKAELEKGKPQKIIFSYHGIPKKYLIEGDPYHCFCLKTTRLVKEHLNLKEEDIITTFQSRFGSQEWLQPYTDETLKKFPREGIQNVHIISPGFSTDCLETLEELKEENKEYFMQAGGKSYHYISCLNTNKEHIEMMSYLIRKHTQGWKV